jgi:hypothetical protein
MSKKERIEFDIVTTNTKDAATSVKNFSAGVVAGYAAIAAAAASVASEVKESIDLFLEQDKMNNAVADAFGKSSDAINKFANDIQAVTTTGNEQVQKLALIANSLGVANEDINETVKKSIGLSEMWKERGVTQEQVMEALSRAANGNFKAFEKLYPELKTVTDETEKMRIINDLAAEGFNKSEKYAKTYSGRIQQMKNSMGDLKEVIGGQFLAGIFDPEDATSVTDGINSIIASFEKTGFITEYIERLKEPFVRIFQIFSDLMNMFGAGEESVDSFAIILDVLTYTMELATLPMNAMLSFFEAFVKLIKGDVNGALASLLKPLKDILEPIISIAKELGILSEDFELFAEETETVAEDTKFSINGMKNSLTKFAGDGTKAYLDIAESQYYLKQKTFELNKEFINLNEEQMKSLNKLTLAYLTASHDRITAYIKEVGIFDLLDSEKLKKLIESEKEAKKIYDESIKKYEKLNNNKNKNDSDSAQEKLKTVEELNNELRALNQSEFEKNTEELRKKYEADKILYKNNKEKLIILEKIYNENNEKLISEYFDNIEKLNLDRKIKELEILKESSNDKDEILKYDLELLKLNYQKDIDEAGENSELKLAIYNKYLEDKKKLTDTSEFDKTKMEARISLGLEEYDIELENLKKHLKDKNITKEEYDDLYFKTLKDRQKLANEENFNLNVDTSKAITTSLSNLLDSAMNFELENYEKTEEQKKQIRKKYAIMDALTSISEVGINTAVAITKALADLGPIGGPIAAFLIGATAVTQAAMITSETSKIMSYGSGGMIGGEYHQNGGTNINAEKGEIIINKNSSSLFTELLSLMNVVGGGKSFSKPSNITQNKNHQIINLKTYVVGSEITNQQRKDEILNKKSLF